MSKRQAEKAERNRQSVARLNRALPGIFPSAVMSWALGRPFVPPTPRLGRRLWKSADVDHRVPLFRVWSEHRGTPWPELLSYWGLPNLQVINRDVHAAKCALEARDRRAALPTVTSQ